MAKPTKPRCPAMKIFADLSELKESDVVFVKRKKDFSERVLEIKEIRVRINC